MGFSRSSVIGQLLSTALAHNIYESVGLLEKKEEPAQVPGAPPVPEIAKETAAETITKSQQVAQANYVAKKRAASRSRSIFSSPLGIAGEAETARKTLLGQ